MVEANAKRVEDTVVEKVSEHIRKDMQSSVDRATTQIVKSNNKLVGDLSTSVHKLEAKMAELRVFSSLQIEAPTPKAPRLVNLNNINCNE